MLKKYWLIPLLCSSFILVACTHSEISAISETSIHYVTDSITLEVKQTVPEVNYDNILATDPSVPIHFESLFHIITEEDTLYSIALEYETSVEILQQINPFIDPSSLRINQRLRIPPEGFPLHHEISLSITAINPYEVVNFNPDLTYSFLSSRGWIFLIETHHNLYSLQIFYQDLSFQPMMPFLTPVLGDLTISDNGTASILMKYYDQITTRNVGLRFIDEFGDERSFVISWNPNSVPESWSIYDFTVEFWNSKYFN